MTLSALPVLRAMYSLSVIGVLGMVNVSEVCDDADSWRGADSEQQGTEHATLRNSVVTAD